MRIRPTVQMSVGLALLTTAVLLIIDLLFGVFPDPDVQVEGAGFQYPFSRSQTG
jgi:hypothetical protein